MTKRATPFVLTGALATAVSIGVFMLALAAGESPHIATALRLVVSLPILYVGYSRFMLADALVADRARVGRAHAELRMIARVAGAVGTSALLKLVIEPTLTTWLIARFGSAAATAAPLIGDLGYGPLATFCVLLASSRGADRVTARRP